MKKMLVMAACIIASLGVILAQISTYACPPNLIYQPKLPKSLKVD